MKKLMIGLLYYSGILNLCLKFGFRNSVTIFMLHGVEDETSTDTWKPAWHRHSRRQLQMAIETLSPFFDMISLDEAARLLANQDGKGFGKKLVFTFDDGYLNNVTAALPILEQHRVPGVFYLATGILEHRTPYWIDRLDYLFQRMGPRQFAVRIGTVEAVIDGQNRRAYEKSYLNLRLKLKEAYAKDEDMLAAIDAYASEAERETGNSLAAVLAHDKWADLIPAAELATISDLIALGSHTVNHKRADSISPPELEQELEGSRKFIEQYGQRPCRHFCYPNGNFSESAARTIENKGFASAVTTVPGINYPGRDLFKLNRIPFPHVSSKPELMYYMLKNMR